MGIVYLNASFDVADNDDKAASENAAADYFAELIGKEPSITSASFSSDTTGLINLHDRHASLAAEEPAPHPAETGAAAAGVGQGTEGTGKTQPAPRKRAQRPSKAKRR